jgi:hypothetical protein
MPNYLDTLKSPLKPVIESRIESSPSPMKLGISSKIQEERNRNLVLLQEMQRLTR